MLTVLVQQMQAILAQMQANPPPPPDQMQQLQIQLQQVEAHLRLVQQSMAALMAG
jgi:hypothetical protein